MLLRIGIDARELSGRPTGTGRYLASLLRRWVVREDVHIRLFTNQVATALVSWRGSRVAIESLPSSHGTWFEQVLLPRALRHRDLDVFFAPAFSCPAVASVPRVTAVHDLSFFSIPDDFAWLEGLRRRILVGASIRASAIVLTLSDFMKREIVARFPDAAAKVRVIPLAADPPAMNEPPSHDPLTPPLLVSVGSLFNRRRMPELLEACALLKRRGLDFRLHVVGDNRTHPPWDGPAHARSLGLEGTVVFHGYCEEEKRRALLRSATVALYLSRYEGFGLPALEAIATGVPLIVSDDPPLNEIFDGAATIVDAANPAHLARGIAHVLGDPGLRALLRSRGPAWAARFSWDASAEQTLLALREAART